VVQTTPRTEADAWLMTPEIESVAAPLATEEVLLLLDAVIADLTHIRDRNLCPSRLSGASPAATIAGQIRHLNRRTDPFTMAVRGCLAAVADAVEEAARRGF